MPSFSSSPYSPPPTPHLSIILWERRRNHHFSPSPAYSLLPFHHRHHSSTLLEGAMPSFSSSPYSPPPTPHLSIILWERRRNHHFSPSPACSLLPHSFFATRHYPFSPLRLLGGGGSPADFWRKHPTRFSYSKLGAFVIFRPEGIFFILLGEGGVGWDRMGWDGKGGRPQ